MASTAGKTTLMGLFKRGWNEIPEVIGSSGMAILGFGLLAIGAKNYYSKDGENKRYKESYIVMRPDDPRVAKIRND